MAALNPYRPKPELIGKAFRAGKETARLSGNWAEVEAMIEVHKSRPAKPLPRERPEDADEWRLWYIRGLYAGAHLLKTQSTAYLHRQLDGGARSCFCAACREVFYAPRP